MTIPAPIERRIAALLRRRRRRGSPTLRQIASEAEVSAGTVASMASGSRPADLSRRREADNPPPRQGESEGRCQVCGIRVTLPCRACLIRALLRRAGLGSEGNGGNGEEGDGIIRIELRGEHRRRYLELLRAKRARPGQPNHT